MAINFVVQENIPKTGNEKAPTITQAGVRDSSQKVETPAGEQHVLQAQVAAHTREISALNDRVHELEGLLRQTTTCAVRKANNIPGHSKVTEPVHAIDGKRSFVFGQEDAEGGPPRNLLLQKRKRETLRTFPDDDGEEHRTKQRRLHTSEINSSS